MHEIERVQLLLKNVKFSQDCMPIATKFYYPYCSMILPLCYFVFFPSLHENKPISNSTGNCSKIQRLTGQAISKSDDHAAQG